MAGDTIITIVGNITNDPELRFTPSGAAVANFTIASTPRTFDRQSNEWKDGETLFMRCSVWREAAENVAESLTRGTAVIAQGRLQSRSFETKEGEKRTVLEMQVDEIGPSLRRATAKGTKAQRGGGGGVGGGGRGGGGAGGGGRARRRGGGGGVGGGGRGGPGVWGAGPARGGGGGAAPGGAASGSTPRGPPARRAASAAAPRGVAVRRTTTRRSEPHQHVSQHSKESSEP